MKYVKRTHISVASAGIIGNKPVTSLWAASKAEAFTSESEAKSDSMSLCDYLVFAYPIGIGSKFRFWLACIWKS